jgi:integrase
MRAKGEGSVVKAGKGFRAYVTVGGKRQYTKVYPTKALASAAKKELIARRDDGRLVAGATGTVGQWMVHWLDNVAKHRPTTYAMDKWVIEKKIIPAFGSVKLSALTVEHLEQWLGGLKVAPSSQRRYLAPLKTALNLAVKRGRIGFNPAERVELEPQKKANTSAFSREDRDAILAAATGRNRVRWHLALRMGIRPSEALGLTWPDFDEKAGTLTIRHQMLRATGFGLYLQDAAKTEAGERVIRLPKTLVDMLVDHRREQLLEIAEQGGERFVFESDGQPVALLFTQLNGRPIDVKMDTKLWHALLDATGLEAVRRYKSRHTAATHLIVDSGGDVAVTAKILGHADAAFTYRTYVHPLEEREKDLMERLDAPSAPDSAPDAPHASERQRTEDAEKA